MISQIWIGSAHHQNTMFNSKIDLFIYLFIYLWECDGEHQKYKFWRLTIYVSTTHVFNINVYIV